MGVFVGFLVGYVMGTRAGEDGYRELREAWSSIVSSDEIREVLGSVLGVLRDAISTGTNVVAERAAELRRVA